MEVFTINGALFAAMVRSGAATLNANRQIVNDLNVFPIPDGDTGDNMFMTIDAGATTLPAEPSAALGEVATLAARGMLMGARGNSGVILSRIFAGIARGLEGLETADAAALGRALDLGVKEAYGAVSVPVEGTILTVYRDAVDFANRNIRAGRTLKDYFDDFNAELRRSLDRTPDLLDVLKEAGVVDSGGAGFIYIAQGMQDALEGRAVALTVEGPRAKTVDLSGFTEDSVLEFGYCTEFLLRLQRSKVDLDNFDLEGLIRDLNARGDSLVCFRDGTMIKVHIHTKTPGDILNFMQRYGEFLTLKIENMTLQHNESTVENRYVPRQEKPKKPYGIVAVAAGEGVRKTFLDLGCDRVVDGGQSMNPSAEDLIAAFREINAGTILVYPNNSNIVLTARQAAALYGEADVRIVPTKTVGEGYAAISMLDVSSSDADAIVQEQTEIAAQVVTGAVSRAVRDAEKDGVRIRKDAYIGFVDDKIYRCDPDRAQAAVGLAEDLGAKDYDILLVLCGKDAPEAEREAVQAALAERCPMTEVILLDGGQPIFDYILILE